MGAGTGLIVGLEAAAARDDAQVGGKARTLGRLLAAGYRVPPGFCIETDAYERFVDASGLAPRIRRELGRKSLADMRWEEIWDAALRIRSDFLRAPLPDAVAEPILEAARALGPGPLVVRSSAPGEDSAERSFAGLHESLVGVSGDAALLDAVRVVWASLWSDAALLYRRELDLDVARSRMAVVVQELVATDVSGVGFGVDPRAPADDRQVIEAVPGLCEDLVAGAVDPDRWLLKRSSGELVEWTPGRRDAAAPRPLLEHDDLALLHRTLNDVESLLGAPPDVEWTGRETAFTLLQARPVTTAADDDADREWYLTLRPGDAALHALCERVTGVLIPALAEEAARFADADLAPLDDAALAAEIQTRRAAHERWQAVYREEFIPFAHGVRRFGQLYNDAVRPDDPYEFVGLLESQTLLATERNAALAELAGLVRRDAGLAAALRSVRDALPTREAWRALDDPRLTPGFRAAFDDFLDRHMDLTFRDEDLAERPDLSLAIVLEMADDDDDGPGTPPPGRADALERRLLDAAGPEREAECLESLRVARLSWRLRDDDNILMGRLQRQLQRAVRLGAERLAAAGRLDDPTPPGARAAATVAAALLDPEGGPVTLPRRSAPEARVPRPEEDGVPRQLVGQPAARGLATGRVRVVRGPADFRAFRRGEIMVCDAIQPTMTHLVPLAAGIVERRGGMLIHGAIIARELGVPCVNGVPDAPVLLEDGDLVTVDGHLGIVTVGEAEFGLEQGA